MKERTVLTVAVAAGLVSLLTVGMLGYRLLKHASPESAGRPPVSYTHLDVYKRQQRWWMVPRIEEEIYYEVVFWGGGHILQFQHAILMVVAWLWIAMHLGKPLVVSPRALAALFFVASLPLFAVPLMYLMVPPGSLPHMELFAQLMKWGHPYICLLYTSRCV